MLRYALALVSLGMDSPESLVGFEALLHTFGISQVGKVSGIKSSFDPHKIGTWKEKIWYIYSNFV